MSTKPIFLATHPRACSTAFERVFMTRRDILHCVHEPFGDPFYFGPERLSDRYAKDEEARKSSGYANTTYKDVMETLVHPAGSEGKRLFIKDIAHYLFPPNQEAASLAPSLIDASINKTANGTAHTNGTTTNSASPHANPTVVPLSLLRDFHVTFLIRHPRRAIPSYYRCTIPPLSAKTGFHHFMPSEAGYEELRRLFDYLLQEGVITKEQQNGTATSSNSNNNGGRGGGVKITVVDADDLLDKPDEVVRAYCEDVGIDYHPDMLKWGDEEGQRLAVEAFEKWNGFHDDAIGSTELRARVHPKKTPTEAEENEEWLTKYGEEGQRVIRACVDANVADYEYLKSFAIKV
ncbi:P-loop containing nucleoside triphosphate hydrolase protein [Chaetomidium leptoderma]|uniref:P-loop containing nucleoside triphosphate hydrolase protein n=1 Tax=Chaetomidium leptoderma TaxID=669021 RepID=A0AAN6VE72_9PEZI|nr:P-loop containing nucleoside triphosphate hydrolase protein [Chaetomidium leptoderma]